MCSDSRTDSSSHFSCFHGAEGFFSLAIVFFQSRDETGEFLQGGSSSTAVYPMRVGKMLHLPGDIKTHHSNCVNTKRTLDKREVVLLLLDMTTNEWINIQEEKGKRKEDVVDVKRERDEERDTSEGRRGTVSQKTKRCVCVCRFMCFDMWNCTANLET